MGIGIPHLRPMNIDRNGEIDLSVIKYVKIKEGPRLKKGDVLFNNTNSPDLIGKTALITSNEDFAFSNHMTRLRVPDDISAGFISLQLHYFWMRGYYKYHCTKHVNQASISSTTLAQKVPIVLPPLNEQIAIVNEIEKQFTRLDAGVAALKRLQANLKRYRASVLKAACEGKLVPTEAELARKEGRDYEPASVLLERILKERREKWEKENAGKVKKKYVEPKGQDTSNMPELPEGWCWTKWEQIGFSQNGRAFPSKEYKSSGIKLLRPGNLHFSGKVIWNNENTRYMANKWSYDYPEYIIGPDELIMNLTAQSLKDDFLGRICKTSNDEECLLNQRLARLSPIVVNSNYLLCVFKSNSFREFVRGLNTGSLIQHMFTSQLAEFPIPLPPLEEQQRIVDEVTRRISLLEEIEAVTNDNLIKTEHLKLAVLNSAFIEG